MEKPSRPSQRIACLCLPSPTPPDLWEDLLAALEAHTPCVEEAGLLAAEAILYLDARGVVPRYLSEVAWCQAVLVEAQRSAQVPAKLGLASSKFAAWVASQSVSDSPYRLITQPDRAFLAPLPVSWLPLSAEVQRRLRLLGLRTIGQFAALPRNAVAVQFGPESLTAHLWAKGLDERPVTPRRRQILEARHTFELPEPRREALIACALLLCQRALQDLPTSPRAWAVKRVELIALLAEGETLRRSAWLGDTPAPQALRALLTNMVDSLQGESAGVSELGVKLLGLEPAQGRQLNLFAYSESRLRLEQALEHLSKKHSPSCVLQAALLDAEAPLLAQRYAFRSYQP